MNDNTPSPRRRRWLLWAVWSAFTLVVLAALLYAYAAWSGARRWEKINARITAEGETLDFRALLPQPLDPAQNFCAIPALDGLRDETTGKGDASDPGYKRDRLAAIRFELPSSPGVAHSAKGAGAGKAGAGPAFVMPELYGVSLGQSLPPEDLLKTVSQSFAGVVVLDPAQSVEARLAAVRAEFDKKHPVLRELSAASRDRTQAEFTTPLRDTKLPNLLLSLRLPHMSAITPAGKGLCFRSILGSAMGDEATAVADTLATLRLAAGCSREPLLINHLVSLTAQRHALEAGWEILRRREASARDLKLLQEAFEAHHLEEFLLFALRGEMVAGLNAADRLCQDPAAFNQMLGGGAGTTPGFFDSLAGLTPRAFFVHNKAAMAEAELDHVILPLKKFGLLAFAGSAEALEARLQADGSLFQRPDQLLMKLVAPSLSPVSNISLYGETCRRFAILACALERHYLDHGSYPQSLEALVPDYLTAIPKDVMDGQPIRCRPTPNGRYMLWSIAFDRRDDGGTVNVPAGKQAPPLTKTNYVGDWTWKYPPTP